MNNFIIKFKIAQGRFVAVNNGGGTLSEVDAMGWTQNKNMANYSKSSVWNLQGSEDNSARTNMVKLELSEDSQI